jgi:hypothetical protein
MEKHNFNDVPLHMVVKYIHTYRQQQRKLCKRYHAYPY